MNILSALVILGIPQKQAAVCPVPVADKAIVRQEIVSYVGLNMVGIELLDKQQKGHHGHHIRTFTTSGSTPDVQNIAFGVVDDKDRRPEMSLDGKTQV